MGERLRRKTIAAVKPHLEEGEDVRAVFIGQTVIPPIAYLLIGPLLVLPIVRFKTFVATDRHLYVFPNKWMQSYAYSGAPYKVAIDQANFQSGSMFARVNGGPRAWCAPFGPIKKRLDELVSAVRDAQGASKPTGASA
jgi:hypothetical protein